jgi:hypothetical protein
MKEEKVPLIYERMAEVMADIDAVAKDSTNQVQGFKFRSIDQVCNMLHPILKQHQIFIRQELLDVTKTERVTENGAVQYCATLKIKYSFVTVDMSEVTNIVLGEAVDTGDKAVTKAMSFALKYCLLQTFCIPTEEKSHEADFFTPEETVKVTNQNRATQAPIEKNMDRISAKVDEARRLYPLLSEQDQRNLQDYFPEIFDRTGGVNSYQAFHAEVVALHKKKPNF